MLLQCNFESIAGSFLEGEGPAGPVAKTYFATRIDFFNATRQQVYPDLSLIQVPDPALFVVEPSNDYPVSFAWSDRFLLKSDWSGSLGRLVC